MVVYRQRRTDLCEKAPYKHHGDFLLPIRLGWMWSLVSIMRVPFIAQPLQGVGRFGP